MLQQSTFELGAIGKQTVDRGIEHVVAADDAKARNDVGCFHEADFVDATGLQAPVFAQALGLRPRRVVLDAPPGDGWNRAPSSSPTHVPSGRRRETRGISAPRPVTSTESDCPS